MNMVSGKGARNKGHNWEREVAKLFRPLFPDSRRCLQYSNVNPYTPPLQIVNMSDPDVRAGALSIECKVGKKTNPKKALEQAAWSTKEKDGLIPVGVCKDDRERPTLIMFLDDFLEFIGEIQNQGNLQ